MDSYTDAGNRWAALWRSSWLLGAGLAVTLALLPPATGAVIGTNVPSQAVTAERILSLPADQRPAWQAYLERSARQGQAERAFFQAELRAYGLQEPIAPPEGGTGRSLPLNRPASWYGQDEGRRIAEIVLSFQTPAGGWSKNLDMARHRRAPGERFAAGNGSARLGPQDYDQPHDLQWNYVGTFDNGATITQMRFLAKVITACGSGPGEAYRAAFGRGLDYIFAAQYPNGGWPQVWPLQGGYHDNITYNDDAMVNILELLRDVAGGTGEFAFVPAEVRARAAASLQRGVQCVLASQIVAAGRRTVWCQQHDALTLQPASARNYEMPCQSASESARLMQFLMQLPNPDQAVQTAVRAAAAWLVKTEIHDHAVQPDASGGRELVARPGSRPLWARFYQIGTDRPIFGDRDKSIHDSLAEISLERRRGYGWYRGECQQALEQFARWKP